MVICKLGTPLVLIDYFFTARFFDCSIFARAMLDCYCCSRILDTGWPVFVMDMLLVVLIV